MASKTKKPPHAKGLTKKETYELSANVALELQVYDRVGKFGSKKGIVEDSLQDWFKKNPIPTKLRNAALTLIEADNQ